MKPAPFDLAARSAEAIELTRLALSSVDDRNDSADYLSRVTALPGLISLGIEQDERLAGVAIGWPSGATNWWADQVRLVMTFAGTDSWLAESFELAELHVHPEQQGRGFGGALLHALAETIQQDRIVLSVRAHNTRARGFYRRHGFIELTEAFGFGKDAPMYYVLGATLPLR